jgi:VanZ family protein
MESRGAAPKRRLSFFGGGGATRALKGARRAAILWGIFLLALTSWPSPPEVPIASAIPDFDKIVHAFLYGVEGFLLFRAVAWPAGSKSTWLRALAIAGVLAVWGTIDEIHQAWIPGRSMEASDALMDTVGGFAGAFVASWLSRRGTSVRGLETASKA